MQNMFRRIKADPELGSAFAAARLGFVDVLRFIAASFVVAQHVLENASYPRLRHLVELSPGVIGVVLFFLVSGFVMPLSVRRGFVPVDFALRRISRIYPALLAALLLWTVVGLARGSVAVRSATVGDWIANLLLVQDFVGVHAFLGVTWTLILEFAWYALFAATTMLWQRRAPSLLAWGGHLTVLGATCLSLALGHRIPLSRIGMIYAAIIGMQAYRYTAGLLPKRAFLTDAVLFIMLMAAANTVGFGIFHHPNITWAQSFWPWLVASALFFVTLVPVVRDSPPFRSRTLAWLGAISLSIYLLHPIAMQILAPGPYSTLKMLAIVALTMILATISYYVVERPGIELGRRVSGRIHPRIPAEAI